MDDHYEYMRQVLGTLRRWDPNGDWHDDEIIGDDDAEADAISTLREMRRMAEL